jgi:hypothetical protein
VPVRWTAVSMPLRIWRDLDLFEDRAAVDDRRT